MNADSESAPRQIDPDVQPPPTLPSPGNTNRWWIALPAVLVLLVSALHFHYGLERSYRYGYADFPIFTEQAREFLETRVLYPDADQAATWKPAAAVYKYPPFYAMWLLPWVKGEVPRGLYDFTWWAMLASMAGAVALAIVMFPGRRVGATAFVFAVLVLNFEPFLETLWHLQLEIPFVLLLMLALFAYQRGYQGAAGVIIGICASLKVYPVFLLLYFVLRGSWKALRAAIATGVLCVVASLVVIGLPAHEDFFLKILPVMLREPTSLISTNLGIPRYIHDLTGLDPGIARRIAQLISLGLLVPVGLCIRRNRRLAWNHDTIALEFAMFFGLMTLAMPNFWSTYQTLLLVPFFVVVHQLSRDREGRGPMIAVVGLAYFFTLFYSPCAPLSAGFPCAQTPHLLGLFQVPRPLHDLLAYAKVFSNAALWFVPLLMLQRLQRTSASGS